MNIVSSLLGMLFLIITSKGVCQTPMERAEMLQQTLAQGWNTWDTYSQVSYTLMPEGVTINLALKEYKNAFIMRNPLLYKQEQHITLGAHSDDGSYTDLELEWEKMKFRIQSATDGGNIVILVTPLDVKALKPPVLVAEAGFVWQMPGTVSKNGDSIQWKTGNFSTSLFATRNTIKDPYLKLYTPYNVYELTSETGISTGKDYSAAEIKEIIQRQSAALEQRRNRSVRILKYSMPCKVLSRGMWFTIR